MNMTLVWKINKQEFTDAVLLTFCSLKLKVVSDCLKLIYLPN